MDIREKFKNVSEAGVLKLLSSHRPRLVLAGMKALEASAWRLIIGKDNPGTPVGEDDDGEIGCSPPAKDWGLDFPFDPHTPITKKSAQEFIPDYKEFSGEVLEDIVTEVQKSLTEENGGVAYELPAADARCSIKEAIYALTGPTHEHAWGGILNAVGRARMEGHEDFVDPLITDELLDELLKIVKTLTGLLHHVQEGIDKRQKEMTEGE